MNNTTRALITLATVLATGLALYVVVGGRMVAALAIVVVTLYVLARAFPGRPKRTLENWSGDGVFDDLEPGEVGVLIHALPGAICAATLIWLETQGRLRVDSEVPLTLEWVGSPPDTPVEKAAYGATGEEDWAEVLQALYRQTNERMATYSASATARHYRGFVETLWGDDLDRNVERPGLEAWMVLHYRGQDWDRLGDDEAARRVKRAVRISGRLEKKLFSDAFLAKTWSGERTGFFRYRQDQAPVLHKVEADLAHSILLTSWMDYGPMDSDSDSPDAESDT